MRTREFTAMTGGLGMDKPRAFKNPDVSISPYDMERLHRAQVAALRAAERSVLMLETMTELMKKTKIEAYAALAQTEAELVHYQEKHGIDRDLVKYVINVRDEHEDGGIGA